MKTNVIPRNVLADMLDLPKCSQLIANCPKDEIVILIPHYSINVQSHSEYKDAGEELSYDFDELQDYLGVSLSVNDYDDLIADPHGIIN